MRKRRNDKGRFSPFAFPIREVLCASLVARMPMRSNAPLTSGDQRPAVCIPISIPISIFKKRLLFAQTANGRWQPKATEKNRPKINKSRLFYDLRFTGVSKGGRRQGLRGSPEASFSLSAFSRSPVFRRSSVFSTASASLLSLSSFSLSFTHTTHAAVSAVSLVSRHSTNSPTH